MLRCAMAMARAAAVGVATWGAILTGTMGQESGAPIDDGPLQEGAVLYAENCAVCHQPNGVGLPPDFPALAGNENLSDLTLIVGNVHGGKNAMPAFPNLRAEEIAAIASYVRNTWGNAFGSTTAEEVTTILAGLPEAGTEAAGMTIWEGVFTEEQAARAQAVYTGSCAKCHGDRLNGAAQPDQPPSPAIARAGFLRKWSGQTLQTLFEYIHTTMPLDNPGQLAEQQVADVLAYMLSVSGAEPGDAELPTDPAGLGGIAITEKPE